MSDNTAIEWTEATWNPVRGCTKVSEGCRNCYAMGVAYRFSGPGQPYEGLAHKVNGKAEWTNKVVVVPELLHAPLRWRKPRRIFVNSMSDLFHPDVPDNAIEAVWRIMGSCPHHTFQILTKRPERMARLLRSWQGRHEYHLRRPLPNVWLGVSVENQQAADERIPWLLRTPAAVRWLSCEPLLGEVSLAHYIIDDWTRIGDDVHYHHDGDVTRALHWVVVGGESGPHARPMHPQWAQSLRDQCQAAGVPFFFKQWGEWIPATERAHRDCEIWSDLVADKPWGLLTLDGEYLPTTTTWNGRQNDPDDNYEVSIYRVGKKAAGRALDGRTWDEYPVQPEPTHELR